MEAGSKLKACPRCGRQSESLMPVETGMKVALETTGAAAESFTSVCPNCYEELSGSVSKGFQLRLEQEQREKNKAQLWSNRVNLIKSARQHMMHKAYSEAAVSYEKYLRILEIVYNKKAGELTPEVFNNSKRSKELTVVASVYWDLMRIYDTNARYQDRMKDAATKLAVFIPFSPLYPDILKKSEAFLKTAKNPQVVRNFMKSLRGRSGKCFIATAAFDYPCAPEVMVLRQFRDQILANKPLGRRFIAQYYRYSPPVATWLSRHPAVKPLFRVPLRWMARHLQNQLEKN